MSISNNFKKSTNMTKLVYFFSLFLSVPAGLMIYDQTVTGIFIYAILTISFLFFFKAKDMGIYLSDLLDKKDSILESYSLEELKQTLTYKNQILKTLIFIMVGFSLLFDQFSFAGLAGLATFFSVGLTLFAIVYISHVNALVKSSLDLQSKN